MKTSTKFTGLTAITAALAVTLALTGCVETPNVVPSPTSSQGATPSSDPTNAPAFDYAVGDELTEIDAMEVLRDMESPYRAYQMPDESWVLIAKSEPLPTVVSDDISLKAKSLPVFGANNDGIKSAVSTSISFVAQLEYETGKSIALVTRFFAGNDAGEYCDCWRIIAGGLLPKQIQEHEVGAAVAIVQSAISARSDSASWVIVIGH